MIRRALLGAFVAACALVPLSGAPAAGAAKQPVAVGIAQREYYISAYRKTVPPGPVKFNLRNYGEDAHNLVVTGPGGFTAIGPDVEPGAGTSWIVGLARTGTYRLLCTRANHLSLGMKSKLKVVAPPKGKKKKRKRRR